MSSTSNKVVRRQPRGSINRRACQKCRQLKIRCDGDAEKDLSCSNCDRGTCVYGKSPRKNRQVEKLNNRVESLEKTLTETSLTLKEIQGKHDSVINIYKLEKQILNLFSDCVAFFTNTPDDQNVFNQLRQAINESRCWAILLPIIRNLLLRLLQTDNDANIRIIAILKNIAENTMKYCNPNDSFNPEAAPPPNLFNEAVAQLELSNYQQTFNTPTITTTITDSFSPIIPMTGELANLALHSPVSDAGSDMSQHLTSNFDLSSPLTPIDQYSHSGSEYGTSPVDTSMNYFQQPIFENYLDFFDYGSNSPNGAQ